MLRLLAMVTQAFMFWLPLALAAVMVVVAFWNGNVGMGILAVVIALVAGLYRLVMVVAVDGKEKSPELVGPPLPPRVIRGRDGRLYRRWSGWVADGTIHINALVLLEKRNVFGPAVDAQEQASDRRP